MEGWTDVATASGAPGRARSTAEVMHQKFGGIDKSYDQD